MVGIKPLNQILRPRLILQALIYWKFLRLPTRRFLVGATQATGPGYIRRLVQGGHLDWHRGTGGPAAPGHFQASPSIRNLSFSWWH